MKKEQNHPHYGHRQRLKDKVRNHGLKVLADHEILELLLTYTIPRRDTNELAHRLLEKYKTLSAVVDADRKSLVKIIGLGEESSLFLNILGQFCSIYKTSKIKEKVTKILSTADGVKYFRQNFYVSEREFMHVVCLNAQGTIVGSVDVNGVSDSEVSMHINDIIAELNNKNTKSIIMFHTHPKGSVNPSAADFETTNRINEICRVMGISLYDHIIFNETKAYSFRSEKIL